jgi:putative (di)nucleoside polyphosphate hydrolase
MAKVTFRVGVGAVILEEAGPRVLAFDRADVPEPAWQLPQGGLKAGEAPEEAVYREVLEETGLSRDELALLGRLAEPLAYELPEPMRTEKTGRGQVGYWFFFRLVPGASPHLPEGGEFRAWQPMPFDALVEATVDFRKPVYRKLRARLEELR